MKFFIFSLIFILNASQLVACTGVQILADDQSRVNGRTVEFATQLNMSVAVIPRKFSFVGKTPLGEGLSYKSKYGAVGIYCFEDAVLMDGINEKGLVAAAFYFPGYASYTKVTAGNQKKALSPVDFPNWILTQFATIEEVKAALSSIVIAPTVLKSWGPAPPPMHYIVYDPSGQSIVIEPLGEKLVVYDNKLGVITNSPNFDWHLANLNNYINLSPFNVPTALLEDLKLESFGQGSGMLGLPGDFTPPSRFVRAAFFSAATLQPKNSEEAVAQTFHILNQFDIPMGVTREKSQGKDSFDYTLLTSVKNQQTQEYFYKSYANQSIKFVDLKKFDLNAKKIKKMRIQGKQEMQDVSSNLSY